MNNKNIMLNEEVECLKKELYDLLNKEGPLLNDQILILSVQLDELILRFYGFK